MPVPANVAVGFAISLPENTSTRVCPSVCWGAKRPSLGHGAGLLARHYVISMAPARCVMWRWCRLRSCPLNMLYECPWLTGAGDAASAPAGCLLPAEYVVRYPWLTGAERRCAGAGRLCVSCPLNMLYECPWLTGAGDAAPAPAGCASPAR